MNKKVFEKAWKTAVGASLISSFTPKDLTPTQKMILARSRIWGDVIGGNMKAGHRIAKKTMPCENMLGYFDDAFEDWIFPFELQDEDSDEENEEIHYFRELRNSRKGKILVQPHKRPIGQVEKYKAKRYLFTEKIRQDQEKKSGLSRKKNRPAPPPS